MTIKILINGIKGKMGSVAKRTLPQDFELVAEGDRSTNLEKLIQQHKPDIVIDLTTPDAVFKNTKIIIDNNVRPVIGTTGLTHQQINDFEKICAQKKLGGAIVPNFSLGAVLMMKYAQDAAKYLPDVEIIEMHHNGKLDSPSGTAVLTAELLAKSRVGTATLPSNMRETVPGARGANYKNIPIHAVRLPGLVAHLQIMFGGIGETVTLRHDSIDRQCFMPGIVLACKKVVELHELVYGLENIL